MTNKSNTTHNKNYISIGVSVRTTKSATRNSGGAARQESSPQSATAYSSVRYGHLQTHLNTTFGKNGD